MKKKICLFNQRQKSARFSGTFCLWLKAKNFFTGVLKGEQVRRPYWKKRSMVSILIDPRDPASLSHGFLPENIFFFLGTADMLAVDGTVTTPILYPLRPVFLGLK